MNATSWNGTDKIIAKFSEWVNNLAREFAVVDSPQIAKLLEQRIREDGRQILLLILQERLQAGIERAQMKLRDCPDCGGKRRHRGIRPRRLDSSLGMIHLEGIYWQCPDCGNSRHGVDLAGEDRLSGVLKELVLLLGVSSGSFDKGELLAGKLLGIAVDDDTIRRTCETEGQRALSNPPPLVPAADGQPLWGSCDGTMVNTRERGWKEVRAARFRHEGGEFALAAREPAERFVPKMVQMARSLTPENPGTRTFTSDLAEWITRGVSRHLPQWTHIADRWHAAQHITPVAEAVYGQGDEDGKDFASYFRAELTCAGGAAVAEELRLSALSYPDLKQQRAVLDLAKFFDKHAARMDYPRYLNEGLTVDSGAMESLCKQLGLRLKGPGMRWSLKHVSAMAYLVARWAVDPPRAVREGLAIAA
jgi:hypothetical protein